MRMDGGMRKSLWPNEPRSIFTRDKVSVNMRANCIVKETDDTFTLRGQRCQPLIVSSAVLSQHWRLNGCLAAIRTVH